MGKGGRYALIALLALALLVAVGLLALGVWERNKALSEAAQYAPPVNSLPPCTVSANFSSLPVVDKACCADSAARRLGFVGSGSAVFVLDATPVAGVAACSTLCATLKKVEDKYECLSPTPGAQAEFESCVAATSSDGACNGLAKPVGTAGSLFLYAQEVAGELALAACSLPCLTP